MRTLLERMVDRTRNPAAGAESALMPLVAPLYTGAPPTPTPYLQVEEIISERDTSATAGLADVTVLPESSAGVPAATQANKTLQAMPAQQPGLGEMPPRKRALVQEAGPSNKTEIAEPLKSRMPGQARVPARPASGRSFPSAVWHEAPLEAQRSPKLDFEPRRPATESAVKVRARSAVGNATYRAANNPLSDASSSSEESASSLRQVTVSIGHIEVRAPQPAPAEHPRQEFRPSLSLSDFLKRSEGGGR